MKFGYFWQTFFLGKTRSFSGVKSKLPSSKLGKSQVFFNTFTDIRKYVAGVEAYIIYAPPPGANRVN